MFRWDTMNRYAQWLWWIIPILVLALLVRSAGVLAADVKDYSKGHTLENSKIFSDAKGRFTISFPAGWTPKPNEEGVRFFAPDNSSNLKVEALEGGGEALESIVDSARKELKKVIKDNKFLSDVPAAFGLFEARHWVFQLEPKGITVRVGQLLFKKGERVFVISYGSLPERWEKHSVDCEQIIASLKLGD